MITGRLLHIAAGVPETGMMNDGKTKRIFIQLSAINSFHPSSSSSKEISSAEGGMALCFQIGYEHSLQCCFLHVKKGFAFRRLRKDRADGKKKPGSCKEPRLRLFYVLNVR